MPRVNLTKEELADAYAEIEPQWNEILRTAERSLRPIMKLDRLAQKHAICQLTAIWIRTVYPDDDEMALALSDAFREQVNINLTASKGGIN